MTDRPTPGADSDSAIIRELSRQVSNGTPVRTQGPGKADFYRVAAGGQEFWVKDFGSKPWWGRLWGRWQIRREERAYRALAGISALPARAVRIHALSLAVSWVAGEQLIHHPARFRKSEQWVGELRDLIEALHAEGWAHLDLRGRHNVLIDDEQKLRVVDLASAQPLSTCLGLLRPIMKASDHGAWLKWKRMLLAGDWTAAELRTLKRQRALRFWWPFNRKGLGRTH